MKTIFNQCCFCFSLETGGNIIGWLYTICGGFGFFAFLTAAIVFGISPEIENHDAKVGT